MSKFDEKQYIVLKYVEGSWVMHQKIFISLAKAIRYTSKYRGLEMLILGVCEIAERFLEEREGTP